ncbi:hypothetical protein BH24ACT3_BH24ACT3_00630 [soil metagenome]
MIVRTLADVEGTERDVGADTWRSRRLVLAAEGAGFSLHDMVVLAGTDTTMEYAHHVEAVYCIAGEGELTDLTTGAVTLWPRARCTCSTGTSGTG